MVIKLKWLYSYATGGRLVYIPISSRSNHIQVEKWFNGCTFHFLTERFWVQFSVSARKKRTFLNLAEKCEKINLSSLAYSGYDYDLNFVEI